VTDSSRNFKEWAARQAYIALGNFLDAAALLGVDACPMEGFNPAEFDKILELQSKNLSAVVLATAGYRSSSDSYATNRKVRFDRDELIVRV
jgi:nitroreductase